MRRSSCCLTLYITEARTLFRFIEKARTVRTVWWRASEVYLPRQGMECQLGHRKMLAVGGNQGEPVLQGSCRDQHVEQRQRNSLAGIVEAQTPGAAGNRRRSPIPGQQRDELLHLFQIGRPNAREQLA